MPRHDRPLLGLSTLDTAQWLARNCTQDAAAARKTLWP
jgi:hypothetical protein